MSGKSVDPAGRIYGRLTVLGIVGRTTYGIARWACRCDCGQEIVAFSNSVTSGKTKSCGCLRREMARVRRRAGTSDTCVNGHRKAEYWEKNNRGEGFCIECNLAASRRYQARRKARLQSSQANAGGAR